MCFSASASFAVAGALTVFGIPTALKARSWRERPLAAAPLLFAFQQYAEGGLWLRLESGAPDWATVVYIHAFLLVALVVWPILVPLSAGLVEPDARRARWLAGFTLYGLLIGGALLASMAIFPYRAEIHGHSILYDNGVRHLPGSELAYLLAVSFPLLLSSHRALVILGIATPLLLVVARYAYSGTYVSVWCFFAAVASLLIVGHFHARDLNARKASRLGALLARGGGAVEPNPQKPGAN